jgi:hypothetical protein
MSFHNPMFGGDDFSGINVVHDGATMEYPNSQRDVDDDNVSRASVMPDAVRCSFSKQMLHSKMFFLVLQFLA